MELSKPSSRLRLRSRRVPSILRRMRRSPQLRELVRETRVHPHDLIFPIFVGEGLKEAQAIESMPGQFRHPVSALPALVRDIKSTGVMSVLVFGIPSYKDEQASGATRKDGVVQQGVRELKSAEPDLV